MDPALNTVIDVSSEALSAAKALLKKANMDATEMMYKQANEILKEISAFHDLLVNSLQDENLK